jgi:phenylacetate-coenzyme A ligase PaaK-like adenylate-forming protein
LPVIEVEGRQDDPLVMAGRDGQPVTLLPLALTTVLEEDAGVYDFQLRQRDTRTLVLRLELTGPEGRIALARCRVALRNYAAAHGLPAIRIVGELGKPIAKGRSGKAQRVVARP